MSEKSWLARWWGRFETAHTISAVLQSELVRAFLIPAFLTAMTALTGYFQNVQLMWIVTASALTFMGVTIGLLGVSIFAQRSNPSGKLKILIPAMGIDVAPPASQKLRGSQQRTVEYMQAGVAVVNEATFPLSIIVESAESEIQSITPPRTTYPKPAILLPPGTAVRLADTRMDMNKIPCSDMTGSFRMKVKYGRPGKERFDLSIDYVLELKSKGDGNFEVQAGLAATPSTP